MNPCISCGRHFPGLTFVIPDEDWKAIAGRLDAGELCPWCADERLRAAGRTVQTQVSLSLANLNALNWRVIGQLEALDQRVMRERAA